MDVWRRVFRAAAETAVEQPHLVDPRHGHRHRRSGSRGGHRRLRRKSVVQCPIAHHEPTDRLQDVRSTGDHRDQPEPVGKWDEHTQPIDVTDPAVPRPLGAIPLEDAHNIYLARTYAYVAAGKNGLVILDIEKPDAPRVDQVFNAGGCINDLHDVKLGITYVSEFAYLADGKNGMRIVQLTSPETPGNEGFSPRPTPRLIATFKIPKSIEIWHELPKGPTGKIQKRSIIEHYAETKTD